MTIFLDIEKIVAIALAASEKVLSVYKSRDFQTTLKDDTTPLTRADQLSHDVICAALKEEFPDIPVISEESAATPFSIRKQWQRFWLVDPLDGTKEFINRTAEFTVNIALIEAGRPVAGVVALPAKGVLYFALKGKGAFKQAFAGSPEAITVNTEPHEKLVLARSRSHSSLREQEIISLFGPVEEIAAGSSLKFCSVAEGEADLYLRLGRTMEWDTAAGHCVVEQAGGKIFDITGESMLYNKEGLDNPGFFSIGGVTGLETRIKDHIRRRSE
ncbi:3'(2'),5'-bisphosphate nucleotidase CysQ [Candidatus Omnitrophota bacterium]